LLISVFHVVTSLSSPNAASTRNMVLKRNWSEIRYVDLDCFLLGLSQQIYRRWVIWIYRNAWPVMIAILFKIWNLILVHQEKRVEKMIKSGRIPRYFWSINLQDLNTRSACPDSIPVHPSSGRLWDIRPWPLKNRGTRLLMMWGAALRWANNAQRTLGPYRDMHVLYGSGDQAG
jgi:hypothetical protein